MLLTIIPKATAPTELVSGDVSWDDLVSSLSVHRVGEKDGEGMIAAVLDPCPDVCRNKGKGKDCGGNHPHRLSVNVRAVTGLCLDYDDTPSPDWVAARETLESAGVSYIWWNTHSHPDHTSKTWDGTVRARILVPFAQPVLCPDPRAWSEKVWYDLIRQLGLKEVRSAAECRDPARLFYTPSRPTPESPHEAGHFAGELWQPAVPISSPTSVIGSTTPSVVQGAEPVDLEDLKRRLRRTRKENLRALVENLLAGKALVPPPDRRLPGQPPREIAWRDMTMLMALSANPSESSEALLHILRTAYGQECIESPDDHTDWDHIEALLRNARNKVPEIKAEAARRKQEIKQEYLSMLPGSPNVANPRPSRPPAPRPVQVDLLDDSEGDEQSGVDRGAPDLLEGEPAEADRGLEPADEWKQTLSLAQDRNGEPYIRSCESNTGILLRHAPELTGQLKFNALTQKIEYKGGLITTEDITNLGNWFESSEYKQHLGFEALAKQVESCAHENVYDPLVDYLSGLKWDGTDRLSRLLETYFGCSPKSDGADISEYLKAAGRRWMISAAARGLNGGCKVDTVLILEGLTGTYKSTALKTLSGEDWFSDADFDFRNKDSWALASSKWIIELGEMASFTRQDAATQKQFLSRTHDEFRPPYGRFVQRFPRRCVFAGTTNLAEYLRDPTGARRFWPVQCTTIDLEGLRRDRGQLWAEAVVAFRKGEQWHLTEEETNVQKAEAVLRTEANPMVERIHGWLIRIPVEKRPHKVTIMDVCAAIGVESSRRFEFQAVSSALIEMGSTRCRVPRAGSQFPGYALPEALLKAPQAIGNPQLEARLKEVM